MSRRWLLDLDVEFQEAIEQRSLSVQTAIVHPARRRPLGSSFQQSEPKKRLQDAGVHCVRPEIPIRLHHTDDGDRAKARKGLPSQPLIRCRC